MTASQTTLQATARLVSGSSDRRWIQLMIRGVVHQPRSRTTTPEQQRTSSTVLTCWPANEGVRRHLLESHEGDMVAVRGELALYEGEHAPAGRQPSLHLGARIDHAWVVARHRPKEAKP